MTQLLAVRTQDYLDCVGRAPFIGLPREEIERLHDVIPVLALDPLDPTQRDPQTYLPLTAYAALHHNYAWLTELDGPSTLAKRVALSPEGPPPAFLDSALHALARRQLTHAGLPNVPCEWRLAGLLHHSDQLGLVYVVRLQQRWGSDARSGAAELQLPIRGNQELRFSRERYDGASQLIIDHLDAF